MDVSDQVINVLNKVGAKMSPYAQSAWDILVLHQRNLGAVSLIAAIVAATIFMSCIALTCIAMKCDWDQDTWGFPVLFGGIMSVACVFSFGISAYLHLNNPAYYAIRELLRVIE